MKFAENNRISHRQLYRQIILSLAAPFLLCMSGKDWPYASGGLDDGNGLLGLVLALVVLGFYVVFLIRLEPYFGDLTKAAGGFPGRVIGAFFLVFVLLAGGTGLLSGRCLHVGQVPAGECSAEAGWQRCQGDFSWEASCL